MNNSLTTQINSVQLDKHKNNRDLKKMPSFMKKNKLQIKRANLLILAKKHEKVNSFHLNNIKKKVIKIKLRIIIQIKKDQ